MQRVRHMGALLGTWVLYRGSRAYSTGLAALLSHLSCDLKSLPLPGPLWTHLSTETLPSRVIYSSLALGSRGLWAAMWTRGQTFKRTPAPLGDGPRVCIWALPTGGRRGGGGARPSFRRHEHITNPTKVEFSNKINLLVWSVFCNFC